MSNKKAAWEHLRELILVLLFIVIVGSIFGVLINTYLSQGKITACKNWVILQGVKKGATLSFTGAEPALGYSNTKDNGNLYTDTSPCITTTEKITEKDIESQKKLYKKLADNMYTCWQQYGEGKIDFYSNIDFGLGNTYCRVCSDIFVDTGISNKEIDINEFEKFLSNEVSPNKKDKYSEFFLGEKDAKLSIGNEENDKLIISNDNHLYTIFAITKKAEASAETFAVGAYACLKGTELGSGISGLTGKFGKGSKGKIPIKNVGTQTNPLQLPIPFVVKDTQKITGAAIGLNPTLIGGAIGCGLGIVGTASSYKSGKIPHLFLYMDNPELLKNTCDSVIINLEEEKKIDFIRLKNDK